MRGEFQRGVRHFFPDYTDMERGVRVHESFVTDLVPKSQGQDKTVGWRDRQTERKYWAIVFLFNERVTLFTFSEGGPQYSGPGCRKKRVIDTLSPTLVRVETRVEGVKNLLLLWNGHTSLLRPGLLEDSEFHGIVVTEGTGHPTSAGSYRSSTVRTPDIFRRPCLVGTLRRRVRKRVYPDGRQSIRSKIRISHISTVFPRTYQKIVTVTFIDDGSTEFCRVYIIECQDVLYTLSRMTRFQFYSHPK